MRKIYTIILIIGLVSILSTTILAQPNKGNRRGNVNSNNTPTKPCNQLTGDDLLVKSRKCTFPNGQVTTVGAYQKSKTQNNGNGQDKGRWQLGEIADGKTPRGNRQRNKRANQSNQMLDDAELLDLKTKSPKNNSVVTTQPETARLNARSKPKTKIRSQRVP